MRAIGSGVVQFELRGGLDIVQLADEWEVGFLEGAGRSHRLRVAHLVDASGRVSIVGRKAGASRYTTDELFSVTASLRAPGRVGVWTESAETGWWNLCSMRDRGSLSFFGTRREAKYVRRFFRECFALTVHLRALLLPDIEDLTIRPCSSSLLCPTAGKRWVAVGDAAVAVHPLTSSGVARALRDAAMAKEALQDAAAAYEIFQQADFRSYRTFLTRHYAIERRWPRSSFWKNAVDSSRMATAASR